MAGLKEEIRDASNALVKRKTITLPRCGKTVTVRGLMTGELQRANAANASEQGTVLVCLCLEHPDQPGATLLNVNDLNDQRIAAGLHIDDTTEIITTHNELTGVDATPAQILGN